MFFDRYNLFIVKEKTGGTRTLSVRSGFIFSFFALFILLLVGNVYLFTTSKDSASLQQQLFDTEKLLEERQSQLVAMANDVQNVKESLNRMQQFNSKLRVMVDMNEAPVETGLGGSRYEETELGILPLHRQELAGRKIRSFLDDLTKEAKLEEVRQQELLLGMRANANRLATMPSIIPVEGFTTSYFGARNSPFTDRKEFHKGQDIAAKTGTPIFAPARGTVTFAGDNGSYGKAIEISHGSGIVTKYAHLDSFNVKKGDIVERYDVIGGVGSTGRSTGPHLHYEVRINGVPTDPLLYVLN